MKKRIIYALFPVLLSTVTSYAQAPGGVGSPEVWFKTTPVGTDLQGSYRWQDYSGDNIKLRVSDPQGPGRGAEYTTARENIHTYNFNPALDLTGVENKEILLKANLTQASVIGVWGFKADNLEEDGYLYNVNNKKGEGHMLTRDVVVYPDESGIKKLDYGETQGYDLLKPVGATGEQYKDERVKIVSYTGAWQPDYSIWQRSRGSVMNIGGIFNPSNPSNASFNRASSSNPGNGFSPELIIYDRVLSTLERIKVETYLAVKYGITLETSYINSNNELIWDREENATYNNRITGYMRDDASGLYQKSSTSAYQEKISDVDDTYHNGDSYELSSRYNLLVMGTEKLSGMENMEYVIFGDNGMPAGLSEEDMEYLDSLEYWIGAETKLMQRYWKLQTNIPYREEEYIASWRYKNMSLYYSEYMYDYCKTLIEETSDQIEHAHSKMPLTGKNGSFSLKTAANRLGDHEPFVIKFGTQNMELQEGSHDYGYFMDMWMRFFKIEQGKITNTSFDAKRIQYSNKIEICKEDNLIFLRINNIRIPESEIFIKEEHQEEEYYGNIIGRSLGYFRHNGFVYSGNTVELSGNLTGDTIFSKYRNENVYLLVDTSATGDFTLPDVRYLQMDDYDEDRSKIIFNNVFWNAGENGIDAFTFALKGTSINSDPIVNYPDSITIITQEPTCDTNNMPQANGEIRITANRPYYRSFCNPVDNPGEIITSYTDYPYLSHTLNGLLPGTYQVTLMRDYIFDLTARGSRARAKIPSRTSPAWATWQISDPQVSGIIAFTRDADLDSENITWENGFKMEGGKLYVIENGVIDTTPITTIHMGSYISFYITEQGSMALSTTLGTFMLAREISGYDPEIERKLVIELSEGSSIIDFELEVNGTSHPLSWWETTPGMDIRIGRSKEFIVELESDCPDIPPVTDPDYPWAMEDPTCVNGISQSDGKITVPNGYNYKLFNNTGTLISEGQSYSDNEKIRNLPAGEYHIEMFNRNGSASGFNFNGENNARAVAFGEFIDRYNCSVEWEMADTQTEALVALMLSYDPGNVSFDYGVRISGNSLYLISAGQISSQPLAVTIQTGDHIRLERNSTNIIKIRVNGIEQGELTIQGQDAYKNAYVAVQASGSGITDMNLSTYRFFNQNNWWNTTGNMKITSDANSIYTVILNDGCGSPLLKILDIHNLTLISHEQGKNSFTARLSLPEAGPVTFLVFSSNGTLLSQKQVPSSGRTIETDLQVPSAGGYIVKAIAQEEYGGKIVIQ
jgi:hypothetical protein